MPPVKKCSIFYTIAKMRDTKRIRSKILFFCLSFLLYAYFCYHFFFRSVVHRGFLEIKLELKHFLCPLFCFDVSRAANSILQRFLWKLTLWYSQGPDRDLESETVTMFFFSFFVFCRPFRCFREQNEDRRSSGVDKLVIFLKLGYKKTFRNIFCVYM